MSIVNVVVNKPFKGIHLRFRNTKNLRGRYVLEIFDQTERATAVTFDKVKTHLPSTLLSRWVNYYLHKELLQLFGKGFTVVTLGHHPDTWRFRSNPIYYGVHEVMKPNGDVHKVSIDDSIGMQNVVAILKGMGYNTDVRFDITKNRTTDIFLTKESNHG